MKKSLKQVALAAMAAGVMASPFAQAQTQL